MIEGGRHEKPPSEPKQAKTFELRHMGWANLYADTAHSIVEAYEADPDRTTRDLSVWNVDVPDAELMQVMGSIQYDVESEHPDKVVAFAREFLRRLHLGSLNPNH